MDEAKAEQETQEQIKPKCWDCRYRAYLPHSKVDASLICDYIGYTGRARMLICPAGEDCTVYEKDEATRVTVDPMSNQKRRVEVFDKKQTGEWLRKPVIQINRKTDKEIARFKSIAEAARKTGVSKTGIMRVLSGKYKMSGGYKWKEVGKDD